MIRPPRRCSATQDVPYEEDQSRAQVREKETRDAARTIRVLLSEGLGKKRAAQAAARLKDAVGDKVAVKDLEVITAALKEDLQWSLAPPATWYAIAASANMLATAVRGDLNQLLTVSALPPDSLVTPRVALALPFVVSRAGVGDCFRMCRPSSRRPCIDSQYCV